MIIGFHKKFKKRYRTLRPRVQEKVDHTIRTFRGNPFAPSLRNHPLKGNLEGKRAISVTGDMRIIFEEHGNYVTVLLLDIGTHNQVYKN